VLPHIAPNSVLADLGCGNGDFLRYIQTRIAFGFGVDTAIDNRSEATNLAFKEGDLNEKIPLDDESIDVVTALAVLEHLHKADVFVKEILRVLKPGGTCFLTTPSPASKPLLEFLAHRLKIISEKDIGDHKRYFGKSELLSLFKDFGEARVRHFQLGFNTVVVVKKSAALC